MGIAGMVAATARSRRPAEAGRWRSETPSRSMRQAASATAKVSGYEAPVRGRGRGLEGDVLFQRHGSDSPDPLRWGGTDGHHPGAAVPGHLLHRRAGGRLATDSHLQRRQRCSAERWLKVPSSEVRRLHRPHSVTDIAAQLPTTAPTAGWTPPSTARRSSWSRRGDMPCWRWHSVPPTRSGSRPRGRYAGAAPDFSMERHRARQPLHRADQPPGS